MGWHGIDNVPPGFDVFAGKAIKVSLVDQALNGNIPGLSPAQKEQFRDLKRHLLHRDYARYFESTLQCAAVLLPLEGGKYAPAVLAEIVEPALAVALEQMGSIREDVLRMSKAGRKPQYDPFSSLDQLLRKAQPVALEYPHAKGAAQIEPVHREITGQIRAELATHPGP
ncbi:MAG: hypothetical protein L3J93_06295 [Thermoplasmata archaeon]|nr:hypothetical protein [Thermoplasmata archaeon]